jgi:UDP-3-O-acyl-N-acetylglucosamine deacetylase
MAGVGYWSGRDVRVEFRPAPIDTGIVFVRADLEGCPRVPATVENCIETPRRTVLRRGSVGVEMIEHIMAALAGLQIDNCELWVDEPEMPGVDGSSLPFVEVLRAAGIVEQSAARRRQVIRRVIHLGNEESWIEARPCCSDKMVLRYELDYGSGNPIGRQSLEISLSPRHFHINLAPSRTFVLESEVAAIKAQGLGRRVTCKDRSTINFATPTNACATKWSTWSATLPWRVATWSAGLSPIAAATGSTPNWSARSPPRDNFKTNKNAAPDLWRESRPWPPTLPKTA